MLAQAHYPKEISVYGKTYLTSNKPSPSVVSLHLCFSKKIGARAWNGIGSPEMNFFLQTSNVRYFLYMRWWFFFIIYGCLAYYFNSELASSISLQRPYIFEPENAYKEHWSHLKPPVTSECWRIFTASNEGWTLVNINQSQRTELPGWFQ